MLKTNWHTHTIRCNHAVGSDEEYVLSAIENGLTTLGFSDHAPYPGFHERSRMDYDQLKEYHSSILALKEKYKDQISIYCGLEVEYFPEFLDALKEYRRDFDYMIIGQHATVLNGTSVYSLHSPEDLKVYADSIEEACKAGLCDYIAHPDVALWEYPEIDEAVLQTAERIADMSLKYDVPVELNCGSGVKYDKKEYKDGIRFAYPTRAFFEIFARKKCKVIIGLDVHNPELFSTDLYLERALSVVEGLDLNILYDFDLVKAAAERKKRF